MIIVRHQRLVRVTDSKHYASCQLQKALKFEVYLIFVFGRPNNGQHSITV